MPLHHTMCQIHEVKRLPSYKSYHAKMFKRSHHKWVILKKVNCSISVQTLNLLQCKEKEIWCFSIHIDVFNGSLISISCETR